MKKTLKYFVLVVAMLTVLCACGGGGTLKPTTCPVVLNKIKELGIYVEEDAYDRETDGVWSIGGYTTNNWTYSFRDFGDDVEDCDTMFNAYTDMLMDEVDSETKGSNYTIIEGKGEDDYIFISRVDNTILLCWAPESSKKEIREFAKDLGYYK